MCALVCMHWAMQVGPRNWRGHLPAVVVRKERLSAGILCMLLAALHSDLPLKAAADSRHQALAAGPAHVSTKVMQAFVLYFLEKYSA